MWNTTLILLIMMFICDCEFIFPLVDFEKSTTELNGVERKTVDYFMCADLVFAFDRWDIVHLKHAGPPHIFLGNSFHGEFLRQTFYNKLLFFLSHFVWMGNHVRHLDARFAT
jgi:hypothetical protein